METIAMNGLAHAQKVSNGDLGDVRDHNVSGAVQNPTGVSDLANGVNGNEHTNATPNGLSQSPLENGDKTRFTNPFGNLPPEIRHITQGMLPLAKLVNRSAQSCWNDLTELVNELADMPMEQPQPNGINGRIILPGKPNGDQSEANLHKKDRVLRWAGDQRAWFIKLLVLSSWGRSAPAVHKTIDLLNWTREQAALFDNACDSIGFMRRDFAWAQVPNPDLKTAAEVLSTGRLASFPSLGYIKPKPLSPKRVFKTLRFIDNLLCSRLTLDSHIPTGYQEYRIHDGRVTFFVHSEFELDLSIAEEDPASQFYFVAFRFAFSPCSNIPDGRLLDDVAAKTNEILKMDGLKGCYDFLHDLSLSYKTNILYKQALEMSKDQWSEQLRIEIIHRTLVVQYWQNRAFGKSWVEIGVKSGRRKDHSYSAPTGISFLGIRWMREGKEIETDEILFDPQSLSLEETLRSVIALHASHILGAVYDKLLEHQLYNEGHLALELSESAFNVSDCFLRLQLAKAKFLTLKMEPTTGSLILQPASQVFAIEERILNRSKTPIEDAPGRLSNIRCYVADQDLSGLARNAGWEQLRSFKPSPNDLKQVFPRAIPRLSYFKLPIWDSQWVLAASHSMANDHWWLVELGNGTPRWELLESQQIHHIATLSNSYFSALGEYVSGIVATKVNKRVMESLRIVYHDDNPTQFMGTTKPVKLRLEIPTAIIHDQRSEPTYLDSGQTLLVVSGLDRPRGQARFKVQVRCNMPERAQNILVTHGTDSLRSGFQDGIFTLHYVSPITQSIVQHILNDLRCLNRLLTYAKIMLSKPIFTIGRLSLSFLTVIYHHEPYARLLLRLRSAETTLEEQESASLAIELNRGNPQERIKHHLNLILSNPLYSSSTNLDTVLKILQTTCPLLSLFSQLQSPSTYSVSNKYARFHILTPSPTRYTLLFIAPCPHLEISVEIKHKNQKYLWIVRLAPSKPNSITSSKTAQSQQLETKLRQDLFEDDMYDNETTEPTGPDQWIRLDQGAVVDVTGKAMEHLFNRILEIVGTFTEELVKSRTSTGTALVNGDHINGTAEGNGQLDATGQQNNNRSQGQSQSQNQGQGPAAAQTKPPPPPPPQLKLPNKPNKPAPRIPQHERIQQQQQVPRTQNGSGGAASEVITLD